MRPSSLVLLLLLSSIFAAPAVAQGRGNPRIDLGLAFATGDFRFHEDDSPLDGRANASLFRLQIEANNGSGFGGGIRLESLVSDDDLFTSAGFVDTEAHHGSVFAHFTYRVTSHRFAMPVRIGALFDSLTLEEDDSGAEVDYSSGGFRVEVAPELTLVRSRGFGWSLYGELGFGAAGTDIEIDGDPNDYESSTGFFGVEAGTHLRFGSAEFGVAYLGRWQSMDESDDEDNQFVLGYDANFQGLMLSLAFVF